jgi:polyhydroxyalkanoate synthesis regulator phasin
MGFLDDLFGKGTEKQVSKVVDETVEKGREFGEKAMAHGKVMAKVAKEKAIEAKYTLQIEQLKYSIGTEVVKKGLPIAKNDEKIKPLLDKICDLEKKLKGNKTATSSNTAKKPAKTAKKQAGKKSKKK